MGVLRIGFDWVVNDHVYAARGHGVLPGYIAAMGGQTEIVFARRNHWIEGLCGFEFFEGFEEAAFDTGFVALELFEDLRAGEVVEEDLGEDGTDGFRRRWIPASAGMI